MMIDYEAIKVRFQNGTIVDVYYSNGSVKRYDLSVAFKRFPILQNLKDRKLFLSGRLIGTSGISWNEEIDYDTDTIFEDGEDVTNQYKDISQVVLGYQLKCRRIELNMSQDQVSKLAHIDQSDLSKIEKGNANPSLKTLFRILKALNSELTIK